MPHILQIRGLRFVCENEMELWRAQTLLSKEPGTLAWLDRHCAPGTCLLDIGANIGCYSLYGARLGSTVYSVEPHVGTAHTLMRNIQKNQLQNRIQVLTCALGAASGFELFNYNSVVPGSSGSQVGHTTGESGQKYVPVLVEPKMVSTVDQLVRSGMIQVPSLCKLDVDGNEKLILQGMSQLLQDRELSSLQVESHPKDAQWILDFLRGWGYAPVLTHYTSAGQQKLDAGIPAGEITKNVIFEII